MNWTDLIEAVAERTGTPKAVVHEALTGAADVAADALAEGEEVRLHRLGTLRTAWRRQQVVRSVHDARRMLVGGRYVVRFRPSDTLRRRVGQRTEQHWRDPEHQAAWRLAETLVGDLALYHRDRTPRDLPPDGPDAEIDERCREAFGSLWDDARRSLEAQVAASVRHQADHLAQAARRRWAS